MPPITNIFDQLRRDEDTKLFPYTDTRGKITIGTGRNLTDDGITPDESDSLLTNDVKRVNLALEVNFPWGMVLDDARKGVLQNMAFNMGVRGLAGFKDFLAKYQAGQYPAASQALLDSLWAKQVGVRAQRLAIQADSGFWQ
jgi:lysozyme